MGTQPEKEGSRVIQLFATLAAIGLAIVAVMFVLQDRLVIAGTLLVFTSFMIYIRETHKQRRKED